MGKKVLVMVVLILLINAFGFSGTIASGLIQYGENIDRERLELLESRQIIRLGVMDRYFITSIYTIHNRGDEYNARLGMLLTEWSGTPSPADMEIHFFVDGNHVSHCEIINPHGTVIMGESERNLLQSSTAWALINVFFPANSIVTVQVKYSNGFNHTLGMVFLVYNPRFLSYFPELLHWGGTTKFSVDIINDSIAENGVSHWWISDIMLEKKENVSLASQHIDEYVLWARSIINPSVFGQDQSIIRMSEYLIALQGLQTGLVGIQRIDGGTTRINFTEEFVNNFFKSFVVSFNLLVEEHGAFMQFIDIGLSREIELVFLRRNANISQRELAPYELVFLTNNQLRIMRNAFFARHGFVFQSRDLQEIFGSWQNYQPNPNFHEGMLTDIDRANIATIQRLEALAED